MIRLPLLLLVLGALEASAQQPAAAPCTAPGHRQFDFWVGEWTVTDSTGTKVIGHNTITAKHNGCVLHENWRGAGGVTGESFNVYDAQRDTWHQTWVDGSGSLLLIEGRLAGNAMVLQDSGATQRITYTPRADGSMTQRWEAKQPDGSFKTVFLGLYRRDPAP